jgi:hypothetical protein
MPDEQEAEAALDLSHDLDMVSVFNSNASNAEMEAMAVHGILEANEIPSMVVGDSRLPMLEFQVRVPRARLDEAKRAIEDAESAGPAAAAEAEEASEGPV